MRMKRVMRKVQNVTSSIELGINTILTHLRFKYNKVSVGGGLQAYGIPLIYKDNDSEILIGDNLTLRTAVKSNSAGIKQRTFISAYSKAKIIIGNDCGFSGAIISAKDSIIIGDRVLFGVNCTIIDNDRHDLNFENRRNQTEMVNMAPVYIDNDVWLGMNVTVLRGVKIGRGAVIGANSTVTRDIPEKCLAVGSPAKVVKYLYD